MSFVFGLTLGNVGWLLSDSQLNFQFKDGGRGSDNELPFNLHIDQVGIVKWASRFRKFAQLNLGFISGAGDAVLCRIVLDECGTDPSRQFPETLGGKIATVSGRIREPLCAEFF